MILPQTTSKRKRIIANNLYYNMTLINKVATNLLVGGGAVGLVHPLVNPLDNVEGFTFRKKKLQRNLLRRKKVNQRMKMIVSVEPEDALKRLTVLGNSILNIGKGKPEAQTHRAGGNQAKSDAQGNKMQEKSKENLQQEERNMTEDSCDESASPNADASEGIRNTVHNILDGRGVLQQVSQAGKDTGAPPENETLNTAPSQGPQQPSSLNKSMSDHFSESMSVQSSPTTDDSKSLGPTLLVEKPDPLAEFSKYLGLHEPLVLGEVAQNRLLSVQGAAKDALLKGLKLVKTFLEKTKPEGEQEVAVTLKLLIEAFVDAQEWLVDEAQLKKYPKTRKNQDPKAPSVLEALFEMLWGMQQKTLTNDLLKWGARESKDGGDLWRRLSGHFVVFQDLMEKKTDLGRKEPVTTILKSLKKAGSLSSLPEGTITYGNLETIAGIFDSFLKTGKGKPRPLWEIVTAFFSKEKDLMNRFTYLELLEPKVSYFTAAKLSFLQGPLCNEEIGNPIVTWFLQNFAEGLITSLNNL